MIVPGYATKKRPPMTTPLPIDHEEIMRRISRDLQDGYDEELEMEIEDRDRVPGAESGAESRIAYGADYLFYSAKP